MPLLALLPKGAQEIRGHVADSRRPFAEGVTFSRRPSYALRPRPISSTSLPTVERPSRKKFALPGSSAILPN